MKIKTHRHLSKNESTKMMEDIIYCLTVIFIVHILMHIMDDNVDILDEAIIKLALYSTLGIVFYHFVVKMFVISLFYKKSKNMKK